MPQQRHNEISAGGVLARPAEAGWEVCLIRAGRYWGLPKGHLKAGETTQQAAVREISEECGIPASALTIVAELPPSEYVYRREGRLMFKLVHHFLVVTAPGTPVVPQASEVAEAEWLTIAAAAARASFEDTRTALDAAVTLLDSASR